MGAFNLSSVLRSKMAGLALVSFCASASAALPAFTFNPGAVGLAGTSFTADNFLISDYATVTSTGTGFSETGFIAITGAQLGAGTFQPTGLTTTYGLYVSFTAAGTNAFSSGGFTVGNLTSLDYTLYGYNGASSFTPTSAPAPTVVLGTGALQSGTFSSTSSAGKVLSANSTINLTFSANPSSSGFFNSPTPFLAETAFNNTGSQITTTATGFTLSQGGGSINFEAAPVPEPESYALMIAGLGMIGLIARRRISKRSGAFS